MKEPKMGFEGAAQQQAGLGEFLWEAYAAATKALEFTAGRSLADYSQHEVLRAAVESMLRIVAASLGDVREYFPDEAAKMPHAGEAIALGEKLGTGADASVWGFVQGSLGELVAEVQVLLEEWHGA